MANPEARARDEIDRLLRAAGWSVQDVSRVDLHAGRGVAMREFPLDTGFGFADYLLYVDGKACGVVEAKAQGNTLSGVEAQSARYAGGLPAGLPAWRRPLPFVYESTGLETRFTQGLDPAPRATSCSPAGRKAARHANSGLRRRLPFATSRRALPPTSRRL